MLLCIGKNVFICYVLSAYEKESSFQCVLLFLLSYFCQFCTSNCRLIFNFQHSRLPFRLFFDYFLKKLTICVQMFLWYQINRLLQFSLSLKFKPNSSPYTPNYPQPCFLRLKRRLTAQEFFRNSKYCCRSNVNTS